LQLWLLELLERWKVVTAICVFHRLKSLVFEYYDSVLDEVEGPGLQDYLLLDA